jgi:hypothetical protein
MYFRFVGGEHVLVPLANAAADGTLATKIEGTPSAATTETERTSDIFLSSIFGKGRLQGYIVLAQYSHDYVDAVTGTYNYRTYVRPIYVDSEGNVQNLEAERTLASVTRSKYASGPGWIDEILYPGGIVLRTGLNLAFDGILGIRLRTTSWSTAGSNCCGLSGISDSVHWRIAFRYVLD